VCKLKAHIVQSLFLAPLFGNSERRLREVNPDHLTGHSGKTHGHIAWASGDFQHPILGGRTHGLHQPGHPLRIGNRRICRVGHCLTGKLFAYHLVVFFGLWHVLCPRVRLWWIIIWSVAVSALTETWEADCGACQDGFVMCSQATLSLAPRSDEWPFPEHVRAAWHTSRAWSSGGLRVNRASLAVPSF